MGQRPVATYTRAKRPCVKCPATRQQAASLQNSRQVRGEGRAHTAVGCNELLAMHVAFVLMAAPCARGLSREACWVDRPRTG